MFESVNLYSFIVDDFILSALVMIIMCNVFQMKSLMGLKFYCHVRTNIVISGRVCNDLKQKKVN